MAIKVFFQPVQSITKEMTKDTAQVILAKTFVTLDASELVIPAVAGSTRIGYAPSGALAGATEVLVVTDPAVIFEMTGDAVFADSMKATDVDMVGTAPDQLVDVGSSATGVFKILPDANAGTVGSAANIKVRINKPI